MVTTTHYGYPHYTAQTIDPIHSPSKERTQEWDAYVSPAYSNLGTDEHPTKISKSQGTMTGRELRQVLT